MEDCLPIGVFVILDSNLNHYQMTSDNQPFILVSHSFGQSQSFNKPLSACQYMGYCVRNQRIKKDVKVNPYS